MSRATAKHLHQYIRINDNSPLYRCIVPECPRNIHRLFLEGQAAACAGCGTKFIITAEHLKYTKLVCQGTCKIEENLPPITQKIQEIPSSPFEELLRRGKK